MVELKGSISKRRMRDGRIHFRVRVQLHRQTKSLGTYETEEEAELVLAAFWEQHGDRPSVMTVSSWGATWLQLRETDGVHRSVPRERSVWRQHIETASFAHWPIRRLERKHVVRWIAELGRKNALKQTFSPKTKTSTTVGKGNRVSRSTIQKALALLRKCLNDAADLGYIPQNPALGVSVPKRATTEEPWTYLSREEIAALFALPLTLTQRATFAVAIYTGLRAGELWGLRWSDVILKGDRPQLIVRHSFREPTKSGRVRRPPLLAPARIALRQLMQERSAIGGMLVFPAKGGGCHASGYEGRWTRISKQLDLGRRVRFHDLRHTCASHLVMGTWGKAWDLQRVRDMLGHSSVTVTERYAHLAPDGIHDLAAETAKEADEL